MASEKEEREFNRLCAIIVDDSQFGVFCAELYRKVGKEASFGDYAPEHKAPIQLGAMKTVPALIQILEEAAGEAKKQPTKRSHNEY